MFKCAFSMEADCFQPGKNEFREIGKMMFQPSFLAGLKFLIAPLLPKWALNLIPVPYVML